MVIKNKPQNILEELEHFTPSCSTKSKLKGNIWALSIVASLFMGVIGYEIVRENAPKKTKKAYDASPISCEFHLDEAKILPHVAIQETNLLQKKKIKALNYALMDRMQTIYEAKAALCRQDNSYSGDKGKMRLLEKDLFAKEISYQELEEKFNFLKREFAKLQKSALNFNATLDSLANIINQQQSTKEFMRQSLEMHINSLKGELTDTKLQVQEERAKIISLLYCYERELNHSSLLEQELREATKHAITHEDKLKRQQEPIIYNDKIVENKNIAKK